MSRSSDQSEGECPFAAGCLIGAPAPARVHVLWWALRYLVCGPRAVPLASRPASVLAQIDHELNAYARQIESLKQSKVVTAAPSATKGSSDASVSSVVR